MTMEIDALHAGLLMRNGLDPCNTCAEWQVLKRQVESLKAALQAVLDTHDQEAKAQQAYETARDNFSGGAALESRRHLACMIASSDAESEARALLDGSVRRQLRGVRRHCAAGGDAGAGAAPTAGAVMNAADDAGPLPEPAHGYYPVPMYTAAEALAYGAQERAAVRERWRTALGACDAALAQCQPCAEPECGATQREYIDAARASAARLLTA
jgi:hypothetical protein